MFFNEDFETLPREAIRALQLKSLKAMVGQVQENVPFYRDSLGKAGKYQDALAELNAASTNTNLTGLKQALLAKQPELERAAAQTLCACDNSRRRASLGDRHCLQTGYFSALPASAFSALGACALSAGAASDSEPEASSASEFSSGSAALASSS